MAYIPPLNGGRLNASIGGNSTSAGGGYQLMSTGTMFLAGGNNITLSQNANSLTISGGAGGGIALANSQTTYTSGTGNLLEGGGAITIASTTGQKFNFSVPATSSLSATGALSISTNGSTISMGVPAVSMGMSTLGNTAGTTGTVSNQLIFAGGNNITLSQSTGAGGNTITISAGAGGGAGLSAGTQSVSTGTVNFANSNGITFGMSGSSQITASHNGLTSQSNQALSASNGSFAFQTAAFSNANGVTFGTSAGSIMTASVASQTVQTQNLHNLTLAGNSTSAGGGYIQVSSGTMTLAGGNNITLSQNGNAVTISGGGGGGAGLSAGTQSVSTGTVNFANSNGITFGMSGSNQITASHNGVTSQSNQTLAMSFVGNTTQNTTATVDARSLSFSAGGGATVGYSNGAVQISAGAGIKEYLRAELGSSQTTDLATNDHVKFTSVAASSGSSISLDTATTYTSGGGASLGRFTLTAGKTYKLEASTILLYNTADSQASLRWYNLTAAAYIGTGSYTNSTNRNDSSGNQTNVDAVFTPGVTTVVELRIEAVGLGSINLIGAGQSSAYIEVLNGGATTSGSREYMRAELQSIQDTNVSANDHLKYATVQASAGSSISLDTVTAYATGAGAASVGRFTLQAGKTYLLRGSIPWVNFSAASTGLDYQWYDATNSTYLGSLGACVPSTYSSDDIARSGYAEAVVSPGSNILVELRFSSAASVEAIAAFGLNASAYIEVLSSGGSGIPTPTLSRWEHPHGIFTSLGLNGNGSLSINHMYVPFNVTGTAMKIGGSLSAATNTSVTTASANVSLWMGIYTLSGSTLSLASSGSGTNNFAWSVGATSTANSTINSMRQMTVPINVNMTPGEYWVAAAISSQTTYTSVAFSVYGNNLINNAATGAVLAPIGSITSAGRDAILFQGIYTAATSAGPVSISGGQINNTSASNVMRANFYKAIYNATY